MLRSRSNYRRKSSDCGTRKLFRRRVWRNDRSDCVSLVKIAQTLLSETSNSGSIDVLSTTTFKIGNTRSELLRALLRVRHATGSIPHQVRPCLPKAEVNSEIT